MTSLNLRKIVEGILYRMRVGCPWRDLPPHFGFWNSVYQQFNRWSSKNKQMRIFKILVSDPDLEWEFIDGSQLPKVLSGTQNPWVVMKMSVNKLAPATHFGKGAGRFRGHRDFITTKSRLSVRMRNCFSKVIDIADFLCVNSRA